MKRLICTLVLMSVTSCLWGADCCLVGGARTINSLQALQRVDLGLTTSFQDYSTWSNFSLQASTVARLNPNLEFFGKLPLVQHKVDYGVKGEKQTGLGDVSAGFRMILLRSLFVEDIYPTVSFIAGVKLPTGAQDFQPENLYQTRSGNGLFEPLAGVSFSKEYYDWVGSVDLSFTRLQGRILNSFVEDNQINVTETLSYATNRDWQFGLGSNQLWSFGRKLNDLVLAENTGKSMNLFGFVNYSLTPFTIMGLHLDGTIDGLNRNQPVSRTASLSVRYGFY